MNENVVKDDKQSFLKYLTEKLKGKIVYVTDEMVHIKSSHNEDLSLYVNLARKKFRNFYEFNVLNELPTIESQRRFVFKGNYFLNAILVQKFGGHIMNYTNSWVLYNAPEWKISWGYKTDDLPATEEIIKCIEDFQKNGFHRIAATK